MTTKNLSDVLLADLLSASGLTPLLGIQEREAMILERLLTERRMAGEALQNITALLSCVAAIFDEHDNGQITDEALIADLRSTLHVLQSETRYDEASMLMLTRSDA